MDLFKLLDISFNELIKTFEEDKLKPFELARDFVEKLSERL